METPEIYLMRMGAVEAAVGLKKSKIYELINAGKFPSPVKLTGKARAYRSDHIQNWILSRPMIGEKSATPQEAE